MDKFFQDILIRDFRLDPNVAKKVLEKYCKEMSVEERSLFERYLTDKRHSGVLLENFNNFIFVGRLTRASNFGSFKNTKLQSKPILPGYGDEPQYIGNLGRIVNVTPIDLKKGRAIITESSRSSKMQDWGNIYENKIKLIDFFEHAKLTGATKEFLLSWDDPSN